MTISQIRVMWGLNDGKVEGRTIQFDGLDPLYEIYSEVNYLKEKCVGGDFDAIDVYEFLGRLETLLKIIHQFFPEPHQIK